MHFRILAARAMRAWSPAQAKRSVTMVIGPPRQRHLAPSCLRASREARFMANGDSDWAMPLAVARIHGPIMPPQA
jgi:hypothetical protein